MKPSNYATQHFIWYASFSSIDANVHNSKYNIELEVPNDEWMGFNGVEKDFNRGSVHHQYWTAHIWIHTVQIYWLGLLRFFFLLLCVVRGVTFFFVLWFQLNSALCNFIQQNFVVCWADGHFIRIRLVFLLLLVYSHLPLFYVRAKNEMERAFFFLFLGSLLILVRLSSSLRC